MKIYELLFSHFGPQHWWPADNAFEVSIGAILTQNTNWGNVTKAIKNIKEHGWLSPSALLEIPLSDLAHTIKPCGYYNIKAGRVKNFVSFLFKEYKGDLNKMKEEETDIIRRKLLSVKGIGPETADSIILYALEKPIFVVDAYTRRIFYRHLLCREEANYEELQRLFMDNLNKDTKLFNEYHALLVRLGKERCRPKPICKECPLEGINIE